MVEDKVAVKNQVNNLPTKNVIWINYSTGHVGVETTSDLDKAKKIFDELHDKFMRNIQITDTYMDNRRVQ